MWNVLGALHYDYAVFFFLLVVDAVDATQWLFLVYILNVVPPQSKKVCSCVGPAAAAAAAAHPKCQIQVRTVLGQSYHLDVHAGMSVLDVKRMLCARMEHRYPPDQQRLLLAGKALEDHRQLGDHSIAVDPRRDVHLVLTFRLRGC